MARPPKLNWDASRNKWRVVYQGRKYRFDGGSGKSDREAKKRAEAAWKATRVQLDLEAEANRPHRAEYQNVIAEWESVVRWATDHGDEVTAAVARDKIKALESRLALQVPPPLGWSDRFFGSAPLPKVETLDPANLAIIDRTPWDEIGTPITTHDDTIWRDRLESQYRRQGVVGTDDTFASNVAEFLKCKQTEVAAGQLSAGRADLLRLYLDAAMNYTGRTSSVQEINGATLSSFRNHLLSRVAAKDISDYYARDVLGAFKMFIRWLAGNTDKLESLPRNIDDKSLGISIAKRKVQPLSKQEITTLLGQATQRTKLYLLLGLNTSMTQVDMAELRPDEVDWDKGCIRRKRSKTADYENVPEVSYPLWPQTFELLKKERSDDPDRVLLTRDRRPLRTESLDGDQKYKKTDAVRLAMRVLAKKSAISVTVKSLKKTSASLLRGHRDYKGLESLFLDHAPRTVAEIHYTTAPQELLNEAIEWLGRELKVVAEVQNAS